MNETGKKRKWKIKVLITFLECAMYITCSTCPSTKGMFQNSKRILKWSKYDIIQKGNVSNFERIWRIGNLKSFQDHKNSWKAHYRSDFTKIVSPWFSARDHWKHPVSIPSGKQPRSTDRPRWYILIRLVEQELNCTIIS